MKKYGRAKRISEKELEIARASSSRASSSLRSVSPITLHSEPFERVPSWLDQMELNNQSTSNENGVVSSAMLSKPIQRQPDALPHITQRSHLVSKMSQPTVAKDRTSVKPFVSTVAPAKTQTKSIAPQHVKFDSFVPPTQPSTSNQVKLGTLPPTMAPLTSFTAPTQTHNAPSRMETMSLPASLPKLKLPEFSGDPLEWPEWSGLFLSTVHAANIDVSLKMNHLKTLVTGKAKEVIAGLGYTGDMYDVAWNTLVAHFGRPQVVVNAQLRRVYTFPPIKPFDSVALVKFSRIVSSCVQVLLQMNYIADLQSPLALRCMCTVVS